MKSIKAVFAKYWYLYVIWTIASALFGTWLVSLMTEYSPEEKIEVFVGASVERPDELYYGINSAKPSYIEKIDMYCYSPASEVYSTFFMTYLTTADIFILPQSRIDNVGIKAKFAPLDEEFAAELVGAEFWEENGVKYAVKMYDKDTGKSFCSLCDYAVNVPQEDYWLVFGKNSKHLECGKVNSGAYGIAAVLMSL